jgi:1-phosphatidylinositol-4-phosphate 5-kinase
MLCGKKKKTRKALAPMDLNLRVLSQKYRFSSGEMLQYNEEFRKLCKEKQGFDSATFCKSMGPLGVENTRRISERIFLVINKSKSGLVSLQEYLEYMDILMHGSTEEKLMQSYRLITQDKEKHITYSNFESYLISLWKMHNALTGAEVSASRDYILRIFQSLDLKDDGIIDFDEFREAVQNNSNLADLFNSAQKDFRASVRLCSPVKKPEPKDPIEEDIKKCIEDLKGVLSQAEEIESLQEDNEFSCDSPEILLDSVQVAMPSGDRESCFSFTMHNNAKPDSINFATIIQVIERLESTLATISSRSSNLPSKENIPKSPVIRKKTLQLIRWGDNDWNLIMNMMIGIQKSMNSLPTELPPEIATNEFLSKSTHRLLHERGDKVRYKFNDYASIIFQRLRNHFGITAEEYINSLGVEKIVNSLMANEFSSLAGQCSSGKSGSFFFYSDDGRFMLKTITQSEYEFFRKILPDYCFHMLKNPSSLLARFYGLHKIQGESSVYFVIMGNLFKTKLEIHRKYDLKGSKYGRKTDPSADRSIARKDLDLVSKINIGRERKLKIVNQIEIDTELLRRLNIIDYSFLVGVHETQANVNEGNCPGPFWQRDCGGMLSLDKNELYFVGIIDFLTKFGTKKRLEHFIMGTLHGKKEVSCVPPDDYSRRFIFFLQSVIE